MELRLIGKAGMVKVADCVCGCGQVELMKCGCLLCIRATSSIVRFFSTADTILFLKVPGPKQC